MGILPNMTNPAASTLNAFHGLVKAIQKHGAKKTFQMILTLGQPKVGELVGIDSHKNEYYENRMDYHGRDRWVLFNKWNFDASQVPPEWHQWLHRMTDDAPSTSKNLSTSFFTPPHMENLTGTRGAFKTYNTVAPKLETWNPIVKARSG